MSICIISPPAVLQRVSGVSGRRPLARLPVARAAPLLASELVNRQATDALAGRYIDSTDFYHCALTSIGTLIRCDEEVRGMRRAPYKLLDSYLHWGGVGVLLPQMSTNIHIQWPGYGHRPLWSRSVRLSEYELLHSICQISQPFVSINTLFL